MRKINSMIGIMIFAISGMLIAFVPNGSASSSSNNYILSSDQSKPFMLATNVLYLSGSLDFNSDVFYNQVDLNAYTPYFFYFGNSLNDLNFNLEKADGSFTVFTNLIANQNYVIFVVLVEVSESGFYNLTINQNKFGDIYTGFSGIGFFEINQLTLGQEYNGNINFSSDPVCLAYYNFNSSDNYEQECCIPSSFHLWDPLSGSNSQYLELNPNVDRAFNGTNPINLGSSGRYIVYNFEDTEILPISEYINSNNNNGNNSISGFNLEALLIIGITSVGVIIYNKKWHKIKN